MIPEVRRRSFLAAGLAAAAATTVGCSESDPGSIRIAYQQFGSGTVMEDFLTRIGEQLRTIRPEITLELVPLVASEDDYFTKNELMMSSERTVPDLVYEDTFILKSDVAAGYLRPIDDYVRDWRPWAEFSEPAKQAVTYLDDSIYAVPTHTDVRVLWYRKDLLEQAGLPTPWAPADWTQLLADLRTIKERLPDVIPINVYSGQPQGEKASMQGFEMIFYGTGETLYDEDQQKWVIGSPAFVESLELIKTLFTEELTPSLAQALDPNISETVANTWLPDGSLAVNLDGSWISQNWIAGAPAEWPEWSEQMGIAYMPTQRGASPGRVTLAGGWSWAIPKLSSKPDLAWTVLQQLMTTDNMAGLAVADNQVTIRSDVAEHPDYRDYSPTIETFTRLVDEAIYRPALAAYPEVSSVIQEVMEAVMTGQAEPAAAAADYDRSVEDIVGPDQVVRR